MKGLNERLVGYTGQGRDLVDYEKLAKTYAKAAADRQALEESWENEDDTSILRLQAVKEMLAEELRNESEARVASLPVISKFDAYQIAKKANTHTDGRDAGIRMLSSMLKKHWAEDKSGDYIGETINGLKKYFRANFPKSQVSDVFEVMAQNGYLDMDLEELYMIASNIHDQDSFEHEIRRAGLDSNTEKHKKARKVIISMVSKFAEEEEDKEATEKPQPDFMPERQDVMSEDEDQE